MDEQPSRPIVAFVRSDNERGAAAEALALIATSTNLARRPLVSIEIPSGAGRTLVPAGVLSAVVDVALALKPEAVFITPKAGRAWTVPQERAYRNECWRRGVQFLEIDQPIPELRRISVEPLLDEPSAKPTPEGPRPDLRLRVGRVGYWKKRVLAVCGPDSEAVDRVAERIARPREWKTLDHFKDLNITLIGDPIGPGHVEAPAVAAPPRDWESHEPEPSVPPAARLDARLERATDPVETVEEGRP